MQQGGSEHGGEQAIPRTALPLLGEKAEPRRRTAFDTRNETCYTPSRKNKSFPFSLPPLSGPVGLPNFP